MLKDIVKKAAEAVAAVVAPRPQPAPGGDPWYRDDERKAQVNANSPRAATRWVGRRRGGWIR